MLWEGESIGSLYVDPPAGEPASATRRSACSDLRRPGGDRDPERAPVQRDARRRSSSRRRPPRSLQVDQRARLADDRAGVRQDPRQLRRGCSPAPASAIFCSTTAGIVHLAATRNGGRRGEQTRAAAIPRPPIAGDAERPGAILRAPRRCTIDGRARRRRTYDRAAAIAGLGLGSRIDRSRRCCGTGSRSARSSSRWPRSGAFTPTSESSCSRPSPTRR